MLHFIKLYNCKIIRNNKKSEQKNGKHREENRKKNQVPKR